MRKSSVIVQEEKEAACDTCLVYAEKERPSVQRPQHTSITSDSLSKFSAENVIL